MVPTVWVIEEITARVTRRIALVLSVMWSVELELVLRSHGAYRLGYDSCVPRCLTKWLPFTRLETRTKESNTCASIRVENPGCVMKVKAGIRLLRWEPLEGCTIDRP